MNVIIKVNNQRFKIKMQDLSVQDHAELSLDTLTANMIEYYTWRRDILFEKQNQDKVIYLVYKYIIDRSQ